MQLTILKFKDALGASLCSGPAYSSGLAWLQRPDTVVLTSLGSDVESVVMECCESAYWSVA